MYPSLMEGFLVNVWENTIYDRFMVKNVISEEKYGTNPPSTVFPTVQRVIKFAWVAYD
jgi:hypothetical protein